jgi:ABC-type Mn2+/Zn2+ transport system ATPase subunit
VLWIVTKKVIQKGDGELGLKFNLVIKGLTVSYGYKTILNNIFLGLNSGRLVGIIGANGSGKSTLLKSILGIASIDSGGMLINGKSIESFASKIAYLPQKDEIDTQFPVTVRDVVLMGRNAIKQVGAGYNKLDYQLMNDALEELGLTAIKDRQISEISGGQLQRVFIARALCQESSILMLDEPFVGVDVTTEEKIIQILKGLAKQGKMIIMVHHDLSKVTQYFDDVIMMNQRVVAYGDVAEIFTNENIQKTFEAQLPILHQKDQFIR